ncbi:MAG: hypothetical protein DMC60_09635 [Verrucomicrobia bacterium]|nr:MAG: hypothetical protein DMC60_09635 [Verrucomicrobiota bacterium]
MKLSRRAKNKKAAMPKSESERQLAVGCSAWLDFLDGLFPPLPIHDPVWAFWQSSLVHVRYFFAGVADGLRFFCCALLCLGTLLLFAFSPSRKQICRNIIDIFYPSHKGLTRIRRIFVIKGEHFFV